MKKLLFMIPTLKGGGAEKILIDLLQQLSSAEWSIDLLVLFRDGVYKEQVPAHVQLIEGSWQQIPGNIHLMKLLPPKWLYRYFVKERYDVVISYLEGTTTRIASGCPDPDTKLVNWVHNEFHRVEDIGSPYRNIAELIQTYQCFDQTVFVSETARTALLELIAIEPEKTRVLYNPLDCDKIMDYAKELPKSRQRINLISIGRLSEQKGYDRLLPIVAKLVHEDRLPLTLDILGEGEHQKRLEKMSSEHDLDDVVTFRGFLQEPYRQLAQADAFVCSSRYEGYSTVVTEATLLGVPVITTRCSGMEEILQESGIITENDDTALYAGLKQALQEKEILAYLKEKAAARGRQLKEQNNTQPIIEFLREMSL